MTTARTSFQVNTKLEDEKELGSGLGDALSNLDPPGFNYVIQNLKSNLEGLNFHMSVIGSKLQASNDRDGMGLEHYNESLITVKDMDHISVGDCLGQDQINISGQMNSPLEELDARTIKSESDNDLLVNDHDISSSSPRKRQRRGLKMEVYVPTMDLLRHERLKAEEDYKKLDKMRNPDVKIKKDMVLHRDTLRARFQALGPSALDLYPITLDKGSQDMMVSRDFMAAKYGGSMQATLPNIGKTLLEKHGMDDFMYLHPDYQPVAPQVPGACGLFFSTGSTIGYTWPLLQRLFTRIKSNVWQYMGTYRLTSSPSLTTREWAEQELKVRNTWGKEICRQKWGGDVRVRVFARKRLGREPTKREFEEFCEEGGQAYSVTPEEVMAAFAKGEEILGVWLMECVGYDNAFQLELCDRFPLWVPPPKKKRKPRDSGKPPTKKSKATSAVHAGRKRKREESADSDVDLNPEDEDESESEVADWQEPKIDYPLEDEEDIREMTYIPRGTRSRPIYL